MKIKIHYSLIILFLLAFLAGYFKRLLVLFFFLLLHELGHILACLYFKRPIKKIVFLSFGGVIDYDDLKNTSLLEDFLIVFSGPLVSFLLGLVFFFFNNDFYQINKVIFIFNILPLWPLDGGRMMEILFSMFLPYRFVIRLTKILSFSFSLICLLFFRDFNSLIVIFYILIQNYRGLRESSDKYQCFLVKKHIDHNRKLKSFLTTRLNPILFFRKGKRNISFINRQFMEEESILKDYFSKKKR